MKNINFNDIPNLCNSGISNETSAEADKQPDKNAIVIVGIDGMSRGICTLTSWLTKRLFQKNEVVLHSTPNDILRKQLQ